jgi:uncharacterized protein YndB with AHSA1/START domain
MPENFTLSHVIPSTPQRIFEAWLSSSEHSKMTGAAATIDGDHFTAWDGYIAGKTLEATPHSRLVQTWRTNEFPEGAADAKLVVGFAPVDGGTKVTVELTNIPEGQREGYQAGWNDFYFTPMTQYFGTAGAKFKEATEALETAVEQASAQVTKAVKTAQKGAKKQTAKAVKSVKKAAATLGKKVKAALKPKKKAAPVKKAKKSVAKKTAAKAKPAKKAPKKAVKKAAAKKKSRR